MAFLELQNLNKLFGKVLAVRDLSLAVERGELVSLLGPSGCGKTTTLRMIAGFEFPDSGQIVLDGKDITQLAPNKRGTGMVFQAYALFPNMTVYDNIAFGLDVTGRPKQEIQARVQEMLELVRLEQTAKRMPYELSGGQQQRIALARALAIRPRVLLLDEPLSALDAVVRVALRSEIRRIQTELDITTVYVTHDQEEALSISDRVVVMRDGVIEQLGSPEEIYRKPGTRFVASFIGTANQLIATAAADGTARFHGATLRLPSAVESGARIALLVRPENLAVHTELPAPNGRNVLEGSVQTMTFLGPLTRLEVLVGDELVLVDVSADERLHLTPRQRVWLSFAPEACQVMPAD